MKTIAATPHSCIGWINEIIMIYLIGQIFINMGVVLLFCFGGQLKIDANSFK